MSYPSVILSAPDGEQFNTYAASTPTPPVHRPGRFPLGTQLVMQDGRKFRFAENGGSTLVVGNVITSAAILSTDQDMTPAAAAVNAHSISFNHGAATVVVNYFAEGFIFSTVTPDFADMYKISDHKALQSAAGAGSDTVNFDTGFGVKVAITTSTRVSLQAHAYKGVIQAAATTLTGGPVGVAVSAPTANQFCWLATGGPCVALVAGTAVVGANAVSPTGTAGATGPSGASTSVNIGWFLAVEASTQAGPVFLLLDN